MTDHKKLRDFLTEAEETELLKPDPYENIANRHRFGGHPQKLSNRDRMWVWGVILGAVALWGVVIWVAL